MADKPSFLTSTFSIITIIVVVGLVGVCVWTKDVGTLKEITMLVLGGYGVKKGIEVAKNGTTTSHEPEKPV